ncbi:hypothetical protein DPMN_135870 [Dreissena polymorpha]|uniref:Uncharacterized protein n=1 Tax=Dreissena polymorpha TaxID=45954 RepID=A0A9D4FZX0_DREPO|nr:hypothetical protein DPMN_135870 [Dreissena polymorpha]
MMLGHDTTIPQDLAYDMPANAKSTPLNEWVWLLKEQLEHAHAFVRIYPGKAIERQKKYHDISLAYEQFKVGDSVFVFFPVKHSEWSPKFTLTGVNRFRFLKKWQPSCIR